jgi:hypothetical protein
VFGKRKYGRYWYKNGNEPEGSNYSHDVINYKILYRVADKVLSLTYFPMYFV